MEYRERFENLNARRATQWICALILLLASSAGSAVLGMLPPPSRQPAPALVALDQPAVASWGGATSGVSSLQQPEIRQAPVFNKAEVRALWVDAFHAGIKSRQEVAQLMQDAHAMHANTLFVQVRKHGDAYYNLGAEPRGADLRDPGYDPLAYVIQSAHAAVPPIEVHAWINAMPVAKAAEPPASPLHVFSSHGVNAQGSENWVSRNANGSYVSDGLYFLDPGHPGAAQYTADVYLNVVRQYDLDGIHLDFIRYAGVQWGFNDVSVARFNARQLTSGTPAARDPDWMQWRREQVTNLVRQVYLEAIAVKPHIKVSAALITWGGGPSGADDWRHSSAYSDVMQDWQVWLREGILDIGVAMNYDTERNVKQQQWFDQWVDFEKTHHFERHLVIGVAAFMNESDAMREQIKRALAPSNSGNNAQGVSLFSYASPHPEDAAFDKLAGALTQPDDNGESNTAQPVLADWARVPDMPWKSKPAAGYIKGYVRDSDGRAVDGITVELNGPAKRTLLTSGTGFFGALNLPAGAYTVSVVRDNTAAASKTVFVAVGQVSGLTLTVSP